MRNTDSDLRQVRLFDSVPTKRLGELRSLLTAVTTGRSVEVVRQGTLADQLLILTEGSATVIRDNEVVAHLTPGDVFGEAGLLSGDRRNASVVVDSGSRLLAASQSEFRSIVNTFPEVAEQLAKIAAARSN